MLAILFESECKGRHFLANSQTFDRLFVKKFILQHLWRLSSLHERGRRQLTTLGPKLLLACFFHPSLTFRTGMVVPDSNMATAAVQAQSSDLASIGRGYIGNNTANDNILDCPAVRTRHGGNLLTEKASSFVHLSFIAACPASVGQLPGHQTCFFSLACRANSNNDWGRWQ